MNPGFLNFGTEHELQLAWNAAAYRKGAEDLFWCLTTCNIRGASLSISAPATAARDRRAAEAVWRGSQASWLGAVSALRIRGVQS